MQRHSRGNEEGNFYLKTTLPRQDEFYLLQLFAFIIFYYQVVNRPNPQKKNLTSSNVNKYKNSLLFVSRTFVHPPFLPFDAMHSAILTLLL